MDHQDWKTVVFKKTKSQLKKDGKLKPTKVVGKKKPNNNSIKNNSINKNKLDGDEIVKIKYVPKEICKEIQQARCAKKLTQKDLANRLSIKKNIINDLESGKMPYNKAFVNKVKRILGLK
jgi:putative transcription factor